MGVKEMSDGSTKKPRKPPPMENDEIKESPKKESKSASLGRSTVSLIAVIGIIIGLGIGYFIWGNTSDSSSSVNRLEPTETNTFDANEESNKDASSFTIVGTYKCRSGGDRLIFMPDGTCVFDAGPAHDDTAWKGEYRLDGNDLFIDIPSGGFDHICNVSDNGDEFEMGDWEFLKVSDSYDISDISEEEKWYWDTDIPGS